ncbi:MAG: NACHT domain-containing protein [Candidatus Promineifilaceae bacterium]
MAIGDVFAWVWDNFGREGLSWGWTAAQWKRAGDRYAERIKEDYGTLIVLGQANRKPLTDMYTYVQVLPDHVTALKRYGHNVLMEQFMLRRSYRPENVQPYKGQTLVQQGDDLFVLGKPGAGKTTLLKKLAIETVEGELKRKVDRKWVSRLPKKVQNKLLKQTEVMRFPVFIGLKEHSDSSRTLLESVEHELMQCRFPEGATPFIQHLLHSGRALVLLDGLDEVNTEGRQRENLLDDIQVFMRTYRESQFVITCRVAATDYSLDGVRYVEMADFNEQQIQMFVRNWFDDKVRAEDCIAELERTENKELRELAQSPLLLGLLCVAYDETNTFPQRQVEIYEDAINALLRKWDNRRRIERDGIYKGMPHGRKVHLLSQVAAKSFQDNRLVEHRHYWTNQISFYMAKLVDDPIDVDHDAILQAIASQHGMFVERAKNYFSFAHLTFQEYFTAKYIVERGKYAELMEHANDTRWRQVFLLVASLPAEVDALFLLFANHVELMLKDAHNVLKMLRWTEDIVAVTMMQTSIKLPALRAYIFASASANVSSRTIISARASASVRSNVSTQANINAQAVDKLRAIKLDADIAKVYVKAFDVARIDTVIRNIDKSIIDNIVRDIKGIQFETLKSYYPEVQEIEYQLKYLRVPSIQDSSKLWNDFANNLYIILVHYRNLVGLTLVYEMIEQKRGELRELWLMKQEARMLQVYTEATKLYVDCLQLAVLDNRAAAEARIFALPAAKS